MFFFINLIIKGPAGTEKLNQFSDTIKILNTSKYGLGREGWEGRSETG